MTRARAQTTSDNDLVQFPSAGVEFIAGPQLRAGVEEMAVWFDANALSQGEVHGAAFPTDPTGVDPDEYLNLNYYDQGLVQYINYYRTGDPRYRDHARKIADSWWRSSGIREGRQSVEESLAPRNAALAGLMLRATDGRPEMWPWITAYVRDQYFIWVGRPLGWFRPLTDAQLRGEAPLADGRQFRHGFYYGIRDPGYMLLYAANLARVHPDAAVRNEFKVKVLDAALNYYGRFQSLQSADGGFYYELDGMSGLTTQPFQEGLLAEGLIAVHRLTGDERLKPIITKLAEHLFNRAYSKEGWRGMYYFVGGQFADGTSCEQGCGAAANPFPLANTLQVAEARQLSGTVIHTFGYAYLLTGDPKFKQWGDEVFDATYSGKDGYRGLAWGRAKEYDQAYRSAGKYLVWRTGQATSAPPTTPDQPPASTPTPTPTPALPLGPERTLGGRVLSGSAPVAGQRLIVYDSQGDAVGTTSTDAEGRYTFPVNVNQRGIVRPAGRGAFTPAEHRFTVSGDRGDLDFVAAPNQTPGDAGISLNATAASRTQINLDWVLNNSPAANFWLERCLGAGCVDFKLIAVFSSDLRNYGDAHLIANTTYRYRVRAVSSAGNSPYSKTVQVTTKP